MVAFDNPDNTADTFVSVPPVTGEGDPATVTAPTNVGDVPYSTLTVEESKFAFTTPATVAPVNPTPEADPVVTTGAAIYEYSPSFVATPPGVVTTTSTTPTERALVVTEIDVPVTAPTTPFTPPKATEDGDSKFVPVNTTTVPPPEEPFTTDSDVIVGALA